MSNNYKVNDDTLVSLSQQGDTKSFEMLVRKYQYKVASVVSKYANNQEEIEDMTQEVFIKTFRAIKQFKGNSQFYTWLYTIASNVGKNHLAFNSRRISFVDSHVSNEEGDDLSLVDLLDDPSTLPDQIVENNDLKYSIIEAIKNLPEEAKEAFYLYEFKSLTYEEIAEQMDCPIGTVRSRIFRARDMIDQNLKLYLSA